MIRKLYNEYFYGKKITVMGLGLLGRGLGDTVFLAEEEGDLIVTDLKTREELSSSLQGLEDYKNITYSLGGHSISDFEKRDYIIKAAGVPLDSEYIAHAKKNNIPVYMTAALVSQIVMKQNMGVTIIGVTGTRGKSTVTQMIAHILKESGLGVKLGGNIRGIANLPLLEIIEEGDYLVLELDSWQLQGFGDLKISPHIAVFTSFMKDHMNYYKNDTELYFKDKANIYNHLTKDDVIIASSQAAKEIVKRDNLPIIIPEEYQFEMKLIGKHNQVAAGLAYEVASQCGLPDDEIRNAIKTFNGVEGRLEDKGIFHPYGQPKDVRVYNDNNATTGDATIAAVEAIVETYGRKPIVIIGGSDKGLPLTLLEETLLINAKTCIFLEGTGTARLTLPKIYTYETVAECVDQAFLLAEDGDIILYSPAFASFSKYFNNEYEKNDAFLEALKKYQ